MIEMENQHVLKIWPEYYEKVLNYKKRFEIRKNDRNFKVGNILYLREYNHITKKYTGRALYTEVLYILDDFHSLSPLKDMVILSIGEPLDIEE